MEEEEKQAPVVVALRWIGFVPAGILAAFVAAPVMYLISFAGSWLAGLSYEIDDPRHRVLAAGAVSFAWVYCSTYVAPTTRKRVVAVIIAALASLASLAFLLVNLTRSEWIMSLQNVAGVVGAMLGLRHLSSTDVS